MWAGAAGACCPPAFLVQLLGEGVPSRRSGCLGWFQLLSLRLAGVSKDKPTHPPPQVSTLALPSVPLACWCHRVAPCSACAWCFWCFSASQQRSPRLLFLIGVCSFLVLTQIHFSRRCSRLCAAEPFLLLKEHLLPLAGGHWVIICPFGCFILMASSASTAAWLWRNFEQNFHL